ncbi:MAG: Xaa-Pro peptidase family protein [Chloroflexi bacterium]|nr:Xaa-Pro peptidase family protein [Chloroflexota bacterium]
MNKRLANLRAELAKNNLDGLIVTRPQNQFYLTGFSADEYLDATLFVAADQAILSTDSRYYEDVKRRAPDCTLFQAGYDRNKAIAEFGSVVHPKIVGYEASHLVAATLKDWTKEARKAGYKLKPTAGLVEGLRAIKDEDELAKIRRAAELTDTAFGHFVAVVRPGMTEKEGAWVIEEYMRKHGAEKVAFDLIVAGGPNSALPHALPGDRKFQRGEPIVVDIGARIDSYHSDMTRTLCLGEPADAQFKKVYDVVLKAQRVAEKRIKPGVKGKRADALARKVIEAAGYGSNFGHGLGHGVGLAVHEGPRAGRESKDVLAANMTLTIEPGIYLPGWGGVRIEDLLVITENGVDILSQAGKEPIVKI